MLDARLRPWIDPPLASAASRLQRFGVTADGVTWTGLGIGLAGALAVAFGAPLLGLSLFVVNRLFDGIDGALARLKQPTDRGGFLDVVCDFLIYAAYPLAFAVVDPARNALAAATLLASFIASGITFLAFATIAAKRSMTTTAQGAKSIYSLAGLAEGFETIAVFVLMCLLPASFAAIAFTFAFICAVSAAARIVMALRLLR